MNYSRTSKSRIPSAILFAAAWAVLLHPAFAADAPGTNIEKLDTNMAVKDPGGDWLWYDARNLTIEGKGWTETGEFYDRLPAKAKGVVRDPVWSLSRHSAGICVRFATAAGKIGAKWTVASKDGLAMPHMPATGVSGLDLYVNDNGVWRWIGNGRPGGETTQAVLASDIPPGEHEFMVYLPLYNGTKSLEIGVPPDAPLAKAPARPPDHAKPLVFYGTSITHGGCASRPGMAYPAILGRRLGYPVINLGFSGNGTMDPEMGVLLAELDAAAYVIDCAPNMNPAMISERTAPLVKALRAAKPGVPIVIIENIKYQAGAFLPGTRKSYEDKNKALRAAFDKLIAEGIPQLFYVPCEALLGNDGEGTVDGTHPTDLGFQRMADAIEPELWKALEKK